MSASLFLASNEWPVCAPFSLLLVFVSACIAHQLIKSVYDDVKYHSSGKLSLFYEFYNNYRGIKTHNALSLIVF